MATDINETVIEIAKNKIYSRAQVSFKLMDIYNLPNDFIHENLFGGFIFSHIKRENISNFIDIINMNIAKDGTIVFIDNNYVEGSNSPITDTDKNDNTF